MIFKYFSLIIVSLSLVMTSAASAQAKKKKMKKRTKSVATKSVDAGYATPYGMAGCGLGSIVIKDHGKFMQITAATSNGTGMNTFAITSGTSNCGGTSEEVAQAEREVYVSMNMNSLSKEAAQGSGESLYAFADVLGCADTTVYPKFTKVSQENYQVIFTTSEPKEVLKNYLNVVKADQALAKSCARLGV